MAQSVTTRLVTAGGSATTTKVLPGTAVPMDVRLDISGANIFGTGFTLNQTAPGTSGFISITARSFVGSPFDDTTSGTNDATVLAAASALLDPANNDNLGRTTVGLVGIAPASNVLAVNLTLTPSVSTPLGTYTFRPSAGASFATDDAFNDYDMTPGTPFTIVVGQTLSVTKIGGTGTGTVTADSGAISCGGTCSDIYPGTVVTLTAAPTAGSAFIGWSGGGCTGTGNCAVTVDAAKTVNAQFDVAVVNFALTVTKSGTGSGTVTSNTGGINCGATCSANILSGTAVTLTPTPAAGSSFANWTGACSGSGSCIVTMDAAKSVGAVFNVQQFALTVNKSGTGTGTVTSDVGGINCGATCSTTQNAGTVITLTAAPTSGAFAGWSGGGCSGTGTCVVTLNAATTVTATFAPSFSVTVNKAGTGTGTVTSNTGAINCGATCSDTYAQNTVVTLTATPAAGSAFAGWSGGGCSGTGTCVVTVSAAITVTATFTPQWVLTVSKAGTGGGTVTSNVGGVNCGATCASTPLNDGTAVTLTAAPTAGSVFAGWSGGGCSGTGTCVVTLTAATTVTATFNTAFTLTVAKAGNGTGTVTSDVGGVNCGSTCAVSYANGTVVSLTAVPGTGQNFTGWSGAGCSGTGTCAVTMSGATTVTATFTDTTPPDTSIVSGPSSPSNQATPTFTFTSTEAGSTFQCSLDGAALTACTSPRTVVVGNGAHTFQVVATDAGGNADPTAAVYSWTASGILAQAASIPTLSEWMLILLALVVGSLGLVGFRRRA